LGEIDIGQKGRNPRKSKSYPHAPPERQKLFSDPKPDEEHDPPEWRIQAEIISDLHKLQDEGWDFEVEGDMNAGKRNPMKAKLTGIKAGASDIRLFFPGGVLKMIEVKDGTGRLSDAQKEYHPRLRELGFEIVVVRAKTGEEAVRQVRKHMTRWRREVEKRRTLH
jgi:hypothetical protein